MKKRVWLAVTVAVIAASAGAGVTWWHTAQVRQQQVNAEAQAGDAQEATTLTPEDVPNPQVAATATPGDVVTENPGDIGDLSWWPQDDGTWVVVDPTSPLPDDLARQVREDAAAALPLDAHPGAMESLADDVHRATGASLTVIYPQDERWWVWSVQYDGQNTAMKVWPYDSITSADTAATAVPGGYVVDLTGGAQQ